MFLATDPSHPPSSSERLQSLLEEPTQEKRPSGRDLNSALPSALTSTSSFHCRHKRNDPYRISSVIKLEYNLSNPIYLKVKDLILKYVLQWFLPNSQQQRGMEATNLSCPPAPSLLPPQEIQGPSGAELMRAMWFTSRDNVSLLLEICRQGFSSSTPPTRVRQVVDLYRTWYQVSLPPLSSSLSLSPSSLPP